jgi:argininosuccinate lyase
MQSAEKYQNVLLPGYTHLQIAMSSFGMWFCLCRNLDRWYHVKCCSKVVDQNPVSAGYGSSFPINRTFTTKELGFETLKYNSVAAQMSRGKSEKTLAFAMSSVWRQLWLNFLWTCVCIWVRILIGLPIHLTTGSSIMPHKKIRMYLN